ncbi:hypothetical protein ECC02_003097 [Trypanosoma cruzi]|uniref:Uncharacterized protein n=1 Tax=Trypanosoma cruzi TaxID=5693 RepID=A0A7J6YB36_TRYCR|nr:hypothetical protein ECC02_003097 [Trypanosoma cruzi]
MITEELFCAFVHQALSDPAAARADSHMNVNGGSHNDNTQQMQQHRQQQLPQRCYNPSTVSRAALTASSCSPLDYPDLLMAYYNASRNALLRYHCDMPFLQPRTTYTMHQRVSPAFVGHSRMRQPRHYARSHAPPASRRNSSSYAYRHHEDEAPSTSADATYRTERYTDLLGPTAMTNTVAEQPRGSWRAFAEDDDDIILEEGRPSWSPRQLRYRQTPGSSAGGPREGSGVSFDALNYGGFGEDDDDVEEEEEVRGRPTVRLDSRRIERHEEVVLPRGSHSSNARARVHFHEQHSYHTEPFTRPSEGASTWRHGRGGSTTTSNEEGEEENEACEWQDPDADDEHSDPHSPLLGTLRRKRDM